MISKKIIVLILSLPFLFPNIILSSDNRGLKINLERLALVIGNSSYKTAPVDNAVNDAEDMAAILENLGFIIILKKNADQRTMEDAIRYFGNQLRKGGVGLFYFAGHGMQVEGRNFLIPIDRAKNDLWRRDNFWSKRKPNYELIYRIGTELKIGYVVTYCIYFNNSAWETNIYVFDIISRKLFFKNKSFYFAEFYQNLANFVEETFLAYTTEIQLENSPETQIN
jgi:hypothetical protein